MKNKYKLSIIIPVYNVEGYIEETLQSVIQLDASLVEIIIIDDGSIDNSFNICKKFSLQHENVKLYQQANGGPGKARNNGLNRANGEYIAFVDSDDIVKPEIFTEVIKKLNKDVDIYVGNSYTILFPKGTKKEILIPKCRKLLSYNGEQLLSKELNNKHIFFTYIWINIYSRKLIIDNKVYFDETSKLGEDTDWNLKLFLKAKKIQNINNSYYIYRGNRKGSLVTSKTFDKTYEYFLILNKWTSFNFGEEKLKTEIYKYLSNGIYSNLCLINEYKKTEQDKLMKLVENSELMDYPNNKQNEKILEQIKQKGMKRILKNLNRKYRLKLFVKNMLVRINILDR